MASDNRNPVAKKILTGDCGGGSRLHTGKDARSISLFYTAHELVASLASRSRQHLALCTSRKTESRRLAGSASQELTSVCKARGGRYQKFRHFQRQAISDRFLHRFRRISAVLETFHTFVTAFEPNNILNRPQGSLDLGLASFLLKLFPYLPLRSLSVCTIFGCTICFSREDLPLRPTWLNLVKSGLFPHQSKCCSTYLM